MFGLTIFDLIVIGVYTVSMLIVGLIAMRRIRNQEDFFLGGRRFGKWFLLFSTFGQATSTESVIGTITNTYRDGAGGIWSSLSLLWYTPCYWLTMRWYRRMRMLTLGDFFLERYRSRRMAMLYSMLASFFLIIVIGLSLKAMSVTAMGVTLKPASALSASEQVEFARARRLDQLTQDAAAAKLSPPETAELEALRLQHPRHEFSYLSERWLVWTVLTMIFMFGIMGGLEAAVWIDSLQGTLILVLSFILIPFAVIKLNALHGASGVVAAGRVLHQELPGYFFSALGSVQEVDFTWYFILALSLMVSLNTAVQANQLTASASARDEFTAATGFVSGILVKRLCTVGWGVAGLLCVALYGHQIRNSDLVWGYATRDLLAPVGLGLVGLMLVSLMAALQATASTLMISASGLLTHNVYKPFFPGRDERHYIFIGRVMGTAVLVFAGVLCTSFDSVLQMLKFMWEFNTVVAASFWCGLKWRRATRPGAWASILTALTLFILLPAGLPLVFPHMRTEGALMRCTQERKIDAAYSASQRDVEARAQEIRNWRRANPPPPLRVGESVQRTIVIPPTSIYWSEGIKESDGMLRGRGLFNLEMFALDHVVDLSANPRAVNETIRYAYKILLPFGVLIVISLLTVPESGAEVKRFFARMRTRVCGDRAADARAVALACADPAGTKVQLLFPKSQLEFMRWSKSDAIGFLLSLLATGGIVGLLWLVLHIGA